MKATRKQHFVWKKYLRQWSNDKDQIFCSFNKLKPQKVGLVSIANKRDFYKKCYLNSIEEEFLIRLIDKSLPREIVELLSNLVKSNNFIFDIQNKYKKIFADNKNELINKRLIQSGEDLMGNIESVGTEFLENILKDNLEFCFKMENNINFYIFVSMQYFRTKRLYDDLVADVSNNLLFNFKNIMNPMRYIMSFNMANLIDTNKFNTLILKNVSQQEFITGDQPVINTYANYLLQYKHVENLEFYYPISPNIALLISKDPKFSNLKQLNLTLEEVDYYNNLIIKASQSQIYCSNENSLDRYFN